MPGILDDLKNKALDVWKRAPTLVIVCGIGLLLLCSSCCICGLCGGFLNLFGDGRSIVHSVDRPTDHPTESVGSHDEINYMKSYNDTPPVVAEWVERGCIVYEIQDWQKNNDRDNRDDEPQTYYFVIDSDDTIVKTYYKTYGFDDAGPMWAEFKFEAKDILLSFTYDRDRRCLDETIRFKNDRIATTIVSRFFLHVDENLDKGYWDGSVTRDDKFLYDSPYPDQHKVTRIGPGEGGTVIVHGKRDPSRSRKPATASKRAGKSVSRGRSGGDFKHYSLADLQNKIGDYIPPLEGVTLQIAAPRDWVWSRVGGQYLVGFHEKGSSLNKLPRILVSVEDSPFPSIDNVDEGNVFDFADQVSRQDRWEDVRDTIVPVKLGSTACVQFVDYKRMGDARVVRQTLMTVIGGRLYTIRLETYASQLSSHIEAAYAVAASIKLAGR